MKEVCLVRLSGVILHRMITVQQRLSTNKHTYVDIGKSFIAFHLQRQ